ncbi:MAG: VOC family protein [Gammaproteobacteria bacterium]|nr:VOC family protein [Gammaproteobacteria bacterium]
MALQCINHLAFITDDLSKTIRFYRDLLGMQLTAGIGHDGYRHYFFRMSDQASHIAFFEYDGASPMKSKFPGVRTSEPVGFDHVSFTVESKEELFSLKDKLEAAGFEVHGAVDHGLFWSIYFYDPNGIPLEATWEMMELLNIPAIEDDEPLDIAAEGAEAQPGRWPEVTRHTPAEEMVASSGNGLPMRESFLKRGLAKFK